MGCWAEIRAVLLRHHQLGENYWSDPGWALGPTSHGIPWPITFTSLNRFFAKGGLPIGKISQISKSRDVRVDAPLMMLDGESTKK